MVSISPIPTIDIDVSVGVPLTPPSVLAQGQSIIDENNKIYFDDDARMDMWETEFDFWWDSLPPEEKSQYEKLDGAEQTALTEWGDNKEAIATKKNLKKRERQGNI